MNLPYRAGLAAAIAGLLVVGHAAAEAPASGNPVFDRVVDLVEERFYDASALPAFEAEVSVLLADPALNLGPDSGGADLSAAIDALLLSLQVSHTGRFLPGTLDYYELADIFRGSIRRDLRRLFPGQGEVAYAGIGIAAAELEGEVFVTDVYDGSPAGAAGLLVGDEIVSVGGTPFDGLASFRGRAGQTVEVVVRREAEGEPLAIPVTVELLKPLDTFEEAIAASATVTAMGNRSIGYIRVWTLAAPQSQRIIARELAEGALKEADGLVLDLRGRWGGGSADAAELFVGGTPDFRLLSRQGPPTLANVRWTRPVVAIIDEGARSGLELFAHALKVNGIPLVGAPTAGAVLGGMAFVLPDDSLLVLAVADAVIADGLRLEGRGVEPDIAVPFDFRYAAGRDPQLDAAMAEMGRLLSAS